jgi:hypothetical protein
VLEPCPHDGPIPLDALRDMIALTRALYVTFRGMGKGCDRQLAQLTQIGSSHSSRRSAARTAHADRRQALTGARQGRARRAGHLESQDGVGHG